MTHYNVVLLNSGDEWPRDKLDTYFVTALPFMTEEVLSEFEDLVEGMLQGGAENVSMDAGFDPGMPIGRQHGVSGDVLCAFTVRNKHRTKGHDKDCIVYMSRRVPEQQYVNSCDIKTFDSDGTNRSFCIPSQMLGIDAFRLLGILLRGIMWCFDNPSVGRLYGLYKIADQMNHDIWQRQDPASPLTRLRGFPF